MCLICLKGVWNVVCGLWAHDRIDEVILEATSDLSHPGKKGLLLERYHLNKSR